MYHDVDALLVKLDAITQKTAELRHLLLYMESHKSMVELNHERLEEDKRYRVEDIQSLCREIANDQGENVSVSLDED